MFIKKISWIAFPCLAMACLVASPGQAEEEETLVIENGRTISVEYTLKLDDGTTVDSNVGEDALSYTQGDNQILPALEDALLGLAIGDTKEVKLTAEQGYGPVMQEAFQEVELETIPEDARTAGTMLVATSPEGEQQPIRVHEVKEETIVLDFNHPLAGQPLNFDVKVLAIE